MNIDRRRFLYGAAAGGLALSGVAGDLALTRGKRRSTLRWTEQLSQGINVDDLGREYLTRYPEEADPSTLIAKLAAALPFLAPLTEWGTSAEPLREQMGRDFSQGQVVKMGGWLLSRTELRLCALTVAQQQMGSGVSGVYPRQRLPDGDEFHWIAPKATFTLPSDLSRLEFNLRSGAGVPQQVAVRIDGNLAGELTIVDPTWRRIQYVLRKRGDNGASRLEIDTTPPWKPENDFRTFGVGIDRDWRQT